MSDREISLRSIIFLVIGILLLLSLVICIYIVDGEKDLVKISADVVNVNKDTEGTGKNDVTVAYRVNNVFYEYNFYYKDDVNVNDKIDIYYHENNVVAVQTFKTSKLIFICPIFGLLLCIFGLFELFKKSKDEQENEEFKTQVISVIGNTQQLKIITDDQETAGYVKSDEELQEEPVRELGSKKTNPFLAEDIRIEKAKKEHVNNDLDRIMEDDNISILPTEEVAPIFKNDFDGDNEINYSKEARIEYNFGSYFGGDEDGEQEPEDIDDFIDMSMATNSSDDIEFSEGISKYDKDLTEETKDTKTDNVESELDSNLENTKKIDIDSVLERVREDNRVKQKDLKVGNKKEKTKVREEKIVLDKIEVEEEVKIDKTRPDKKSVDIKNLKKVLPKYYYVVKSCLVYELSGKEAQEINFNDVISVKKTINSEGNLVKVCVITNKINCVLTNMNKVDLNSIVNTIHNKMLTIDEKFEEEVEYKEY